MITRLDFFKGMFAGLVALPLVAVGKDNDEPEVIKTDMVRDSVFYRPVTIVSERGAFVTNNIFYEGPPRFVEPKP